MTDALDRVALSATYNKDPGSDADDGATSDHDNVRAEDHEHKGAQAEPKSIHCAKVAMSAGDGKQRKYG